jgi:hypothetical protein
VYQYGSQVEDKESSCGWSPVVVDVVRYQSNFVLDQVSVVDNSWQATMHYLFGDGSPVNIGPKTTLSLLNSPEFQKNNNEIMSHKKTGSGSFPVNMTDRVFHVGRTSVSYSVNSNNNTVTYQLFINDGYWDPDFIDERYAHYFSTSSDFIPDGKGPNLERFGGTPYDYIPVNIIYNIP